jgi:hypothetical protein
MPGTFVPAADFGRSLSSASSSSSKSSSSENAIVEQVCMLPVDSRRACYFGDKKAADNAKLATRDEAILHARKHMLHSFLGF